MGGPVPALRGRAGRAGHSLRAQARTRVKAPRWTALAVVALLVVVVDQLVKLVVRREFQLYESVPVIPDFFSLTRIHNTGAAFGMLDGSEIPYKSAILTTVRIVVLGVLAVFASTLPAAHRLARAGLALVLGGAVGNLVDGLTLGYVVDFLDFYWGTWHFWAFNVADASISVGMALVILDQIGVGQQRVSGTV
jgi:signal peptidase II